MSLTNADNKPKGSVHSPTESSPSGQGNQKADKRVKSVATSEAVAHDELPHDHCCHHEEHEHGKTCSCKAHSHDLDHEEEHLHEDHGCHHHEASNEDKSHCCCHDHEHSHQHDEEERDHCCHEHHHDHDHDEHCCCHDHEHSHHPDDEDHDHCGHDHLHDHDHDGHCCCHDHEHIENSMDTDWDVSGVNPSQYRLLFSTLGSIAGVKDVGLNPDGLRIVHTPEALVAIKEAFKANNLDLKIRGNEGKETTQIRIQQMDCPTEEGLIRKKLNGIKGVSGLQFNLMNRILTVSYPKGTLPEIVAAIKSLDYTPEVLKAEEKPKLSEFKPTKIAWWKYVLGIVIALGSEACEFAGLPEWLSITLAVAAIALVGLGTYKKGFIAVRNLNFNMNALMAVAVTGAVLIGSWPEAAMVMVLFELSEAIEQLSLDKARGAIRSLLALAPQTARVERNGEFIEVPAKEVKIGDTLRAVPGERLAVDGTVLSGHTAIDQSPITGESMPVEKKPGDKVFAGTINKNGMITYKAESDVDNSMPSRIIAAIESAQSSRAPTQRFVDSFAKIYTPTVFVIAILVGLIPPLFLHGDWLSWIYKGLTILVIACPCALVISTPVTIVSGLATAARRGILIKGGVYLEKGRTLQSMAFDKTGTLTKGKPAVIVFENKNSDLSDKEVLALATSLADRNDHPVSKAVSDYSASSKEANKSKEVHGFFAVPGQGVIGEIDGIEYYLGNIKGLDRFHLNGNEVRAKVSELADNGYTPLIFASSEKILGYFGVADSIKEYSVEAISALKGLGIKTIMLTGDNEKTARQIAQKVGVERTRGNLLPEDKQSLVDNIAKREVIGMVGDGINDAPALARADIGFAMGAAGTDTAIETADVALMDDDLRKLPEFIRLSKKTYSLLVQNIVIALSIKAIFFILTLMGIGTMWMAVFADTGTCLIVVANGMRMLHWKG